MFNQKRHVLLSIATCIILHNIAKILNEEDFDGDADGSEDFQCDSLPPTANSLEGKAVRDHIANTPSLVNLQVQSTN